MEKTLREQADLEVMLDIRSIDIFTKGKATKSALRLRELGKLGHRHCVVLTMFGGTLLNRDPEYMSLVTNIVRVFFRNGELVVFSADLVLRPLSDCMLTVASFMKRFVMSI